MGYQNEQVNDIFKKLEEKLEKTITSLKNEFVSMRAGRANPHILDRVVVDYYGTPTPISQMGNISIPEARMLVVSLWDASALKDAEKAILQANIGLTPTNDGKVIRLVFPEMTEERRKEIAKQVKKVSEDSKVALRNVRRDAMDALKKLNKDKLITDDEISIFEKDVEKHVTKNIDLADKMTKEKEQEILSV